MQPDEVDVARNEHGQPMGVPVPGWSPRPMPPRTALVGRTVAAEPIDASHTESLFAALCGSGVDALWTYRPGPRPTTPRELEDSVVRVLSEHPDSASFVFVPSGGSPAGLATFFPCVTAHGVVEISGVLLGRALQRTTAATEALHLMIGHAFELGYRRVEWKCDSLNEPSRQAARRLGFSYEGRFRQHMVIKGRSRDTDWFSILDSEWPSIRARHERWLDPANFTHAGQQLRRLSAV
jgi:RimJ/RimL family protein N-acetyltransferase